MVSHIEGEVIYESLHGYGDASRDLVMQAGMPIVQLHL